MGFHPPGPPFGGDGPVFNVDHSWWAGGGWHILPLLMFLILMGVIVWAVIRLTPQKEHLSSGSPSVDPALAEVRVRYARGEMTRDEFMQRFRDLGGSGVDAGSPDGAT